MDEDGMNSNKSALKLSGESQRKKRNKLTSAEVSA